MELKFLSSFIIANSNLFLLFKGYHLIEILKEMRGSSLPVWKIKKINQFPKLPTVHPARFSHVPYEVDSS